MKWFSRKNETPAAQNKERQQAALQRWATYDNMDSNIELVAMTAQADMQPDDPRSPYVETYLHGIRRVNDGQSLMYRAGESLPNLMPVTSPDQPLGTIALIGLLSEATNQHTREYGLGPNEDMGAFDPNRAYDPMVSAHAAAAREVVNLAMINLMPTGEQPGGQ